MADSHRASFVSKGRTHDAAGTIETQLFKVRLSPPIDGQENAVSSHVARDLPRVVDRDGPG